MLKFYIDESLHVTHYLNRPRTSAAKDNNKNIVCHNVRRTTYECLDSRFSAKCCNLRLCSFELLEKRKYANSASVCIDERNVNNKEMPEGIVAAEVGLCFCGIH